METFAAAARLATSTANTAFHSLGVLGRVMHVGGFAISVALFPLDVYTIVSSSKQLKTRDVKPAKAIRQTAQDMNELTECNRDNIINKLTSFIEDPDEIRSEIGFEEYNSMLAELHLETDLITNEIQDGAVGGEAVVEEDDGVVEGSLDVDNNNVEDDSDWVVVDNSMTPILY